MFRTVSARYSRVSVGDDLLPFPASPNKLIRISAHACNSEEQFERLARGLKQLV